MNAAFVGRADRTAIAHIVGAVLADQHDEWAITLPYIEETSMGELNQPCNADPHQRRLEG